MKSYLCLLLAAVALMALAVMGHTEDAVALATPTDAADTTAQIVRWLAEFIPAQYLALYGAIIALVTTLGLTLTGVAKVLRMIFGDDHRAARVIDLVAHYCSAIGHSSRTSQLAPPTPKT